MSIIVGLMFDTCFSHFSEGEIERVEGETGPLIGQLLTLEGCQAERQALSGPQSSHSKPAQALRAWRECKKIGLLNFLL